MEIFQCRLEYFTMRLYVYQLNYFFFFFFASLAEAREAGSRVALAPVALGSVVLLPEGKLVSAEA